MNYLITDHSITVFLPQPVQGRQVLTAARARLGDEVFERAKQALREGDVDTLIDLLLPARAVDRHFRGTDVKVQGGQIYYRDQLLDTYAARKALEFIKEELPAEPLVNFLDKVMRNPSYRAVHDLYQFLEYGNLPLTPDGCFLAYKRIRDDYRDVYSGTLDNSPGQTVSVARHQVDDNPHHTCSYGLHVCSLEYLSHFAGERAVVVKVDPADVVSIPTDYNNTKMRVCRYQVVDEIPLTEITSHSFDEEIITDYEDGDDDFIDDPDD